MPRLAELIQHARVLVFDFDGTLVDSNLIKRRAFARCFQEFPQHLEKILAYCWSHHHTPRGEKFRYVYERVLRLPYTQEIAMRLHARFDAETTSQIIEATETPGATPFLRQVSRGHLLSVLSSTPHEMLTHILERRGWKDYFARIQGAPVHKATWLRAMREHEAFEQHAIIFFGDTPDDAEAAQAAGCAFIGVGQDASFNGAPVILDFTSLLG